MLLRGGGFYKAIRKFTKYDYVISICFDLHISVLSTEYIYNFHSPTDAVHLRYK